VNNFFRLIEKRGQSAIRDRQEFVLFNTLIVIAGMGWRRLSWVIIVGFS
jgi:hypothetical protein